MMRKKINNKNKVINYFDSSPNVYFDSYKYKNSEGHSFRIRKLRTLELISISKNKKLLDIGCGPGVIINESIMKGYKYYGLDISKEMVKFAKVNYKERGNFCIGDVEDICFKDKCFDLVVAMGLFEYLNDDKKLINEICRSLNNNGEFIVTFPNKTSIYRMVRKVTLDIYSNMKKLISKKNDIIIHKEYEVKEVCRLFSKYNLIVNKIVFYNFKVIPWPLDLLFKNKDYILTEYLERFYKNNLSKYLSTGFIVYGKKIY